MSWIDLVQTEEASLEWRHIALWNPSPRLREIGDSLAQRLGCYCKTVEGDLAAWIEREKPEILLADDTVEGAALLPPLAQKWRTGLARCFEVDLDLAQRVLVMKTRAYGGRLIVEYVCPEGRPQMALVSRS